MKNIFFLFFLFFFVSLVSASNSVNIGSDPSFKSVNIEIPSTVSGSNVTTFLGLTDVFESTYSGQAGLVATVNPGETGLIFSASGGGGGITNISEAGDVSITSIQNDDGLFWDSVTLMFLNSPLSGILSLDNIYLNFIGDTLTFNETKLNETIFLGAAVYNNTGLITSVNDSLQTEILERIGNNTFLQDTKLNITDQRYNETALILWEEIGNNITLKNLSKELVIENITLIQITGKTNGSRIIFHSNGQVEDRVVIG